MESGKSNARFIIILILNYLGIDLAILIVPVLLILFLVLTVLGIGMATTGSSLGSSIGGTGGDTLPGQIPVPQSEIPTYEAAAALYHVDWAVLAAIHYRETSFCMGGICGISSTGAEGPMQFEPYTWKSYGVDAPGQKGKPDITNLSDAIYSAANFLNQSGYSHSPAQAIFQYNHADWYVSQVISIADIIKTEYSSTTKQNTTNRSKP